MNKEPMDVFQVMGHAVVLAETHHPIRLAYEEYCQIEDMMCCYAEVGNKRLVQRTRLKLLDAELELTQLVKEALKEVKA